MKSGLKSGIKAASIHLLSMDLSDDGVECNILALARRSLREEGLSILSRGERTPQAFLCESWRSFVQHQERECKNMHDPQFS